MIKSIVFQITNVLVFFPHKRYFFLYNEIYKTMQSWFIINQYQTRRPNYGESEINLEYLSHLNINGGVKAESHLFPSWVKYWKEKKHCLKDHYSNESAQTLIEISPTINFCFNAAR